jgi:hypothetical protein
MPRYGRLAQTWPGASQRHHAHASGWRLAHPTGLAEFGRIDKTLNRAPLCLWKRAPPPRPRSVSNFCSTPLYCDCEILQQGLCRRRKGKGNHRRRAGAQKRRQEERPSNQERGSAANLSGHHRWRLIGSQAKRRKNGPLNSENREGDKWHSYHLCFLEHVKV